MKKVILLIVFSTVCSAASFAQTRIGAFLGYGSEVEQLGIGVNGEFLLNEKMAISPSLLFYFPEENNNVKLSYWELNGNLNYYFVAEDAVNVYGLAGLNMMTIKVKSDIPGFDYEDSESEIGINLGIGANFNVSGSVLPFAELKYVVGDADQLVVMFGVKFPLGGN